MTTNNPFADRLRQAAQEGYVTGTRREYDRPQRQPVRSVHPEDVYATPEQVALIQSLLDERDLAAETRPGWRARTAVLERDAAEVMALTPEKASNLITYLFGLPMVTETTSPAAAFAAVPAGYYAIERSGEIHFYRVDRPTEGKWAGKVFVHLLHGPDETSMGRQAGFTVLGYILDQGVLECSTRYGREIGRCGVCHRRLTNEDSRREGIGPKCREAM